MYYIILLYSVNNFHLKWVETQLFREQPRLKGMRMNTFVPDNNEYLSEFDTTTKAMFVSTAPPTCQISHHNIPS